MNLDRAVDRARAARTPKQAAQLYNDIEYELALGEPTAEQETEGERALSELVSAFPDVGDLAREITTPPSMSRTAGRNAARSPQRAPERAAAGERTPRMHEPARPRVPSSRAPARRGTHASRTRSRGRSYTHTARSAQRQAVAAFDTSGSGSGGLFSQLIIGGLALSMVYVFLTRPKAMTAIFGAGRGIPAIVHAVVSPNIDPLNPKEALV